MNKALANKEKEVLGQSVILEMVYEGLISAFDIDSDKQTFNRAPTLTSVDYKMMLLNYLNAVYKDGFSSGCCWSANHNIK